MKFLVEIAIVAVALVAGCVGHTVCSKLNAKLVKLKGDVKADVSKVEAGAKVEVKKL